MAKEKNAVELKLRAHGIKSRNRPHGQHSAGTIRKRMFTAAAAHIFPDGTAAENFSQGAFRFSAACELPRRKSLPKIHAVGRGSTALAVRRCSKSGRKSNRKFITSEAET